VSPTARSIPAGYYFLSSGGSKNSSCIIDDSALRRCQGLWFSASRWLSLICSKSAHYAGAGGSRSSLPRRPPFINTQKAASEPQTGSQRSDEPCPCSGIGHVNLCVEGIRGTGTAAREGAWVGLGSAAVGQAGSPCFHRTLLLAVKHNTKPQTVTQSEAD